jgi:hypothetical protein
LLPLGQIPAAIEPDNHARAGGAIGFPTLHGIPYRRSGILLCPDGRIARRRNLPIHHLDAGFLVVNEDCRHAMGARLLRSGLAEEVVLLHGGKTGMRVAAADEAEFVGIGPKGIF